MESQTNENPEAPALGDSSADLGAESTIFDEKLFTMP
jgi:hypothetical protein